jgi:ATP-binding cassette, subfamily B, bacterial
VIEMDEIIVISGGKAIERGSHAELLAVGGLYRKLWDDQSHTPHKAADQVDEDEEEEDENEDEADDEEEEDDEDEDEEDDDEDDEDEK